jgi:hypothetical protein
MGTCKIGSTKSEEEEHCRSKEFAESADEVVSEAKIGTFVFPVWMEVDFAGSSRSSHGLGRHHLRDARVDVVFILSDLTRLELKRVVGDWNGYR